MAATASSTAQPSTSSAPTAAPADNGNSIIAKNGLRCIICYGPHTTTTVGTPVPIKELSSIFSRCLDIVIPGRYYEYGNFYFCATCLLKINSLEEVFNQFCEFEKKFDKIRSDVAQDVVESIKRSNYLDSNILEGNAFDATRSQIFSRWNIRLRDSSKVIGRNTQPSNSTTNKSNNSTASVPTIPTQPAATIPLSSSSVTRNLLRPPPASFNVATKTKPVSRPTAVAVKLKPAPASAANNVSTSASNTNLSDCSDLISQDNTDSPIVISQVVSLSGQAQNSIMSESSSLISDFKGQSTLLNGSTTTTPKAMPETVKRQACTPNKIDRETAAFAAQALVQKPKTGTGTGNKNESGYNVSAKRGPPGIRHVPLHQAAPVTPKLGPPIKINSRGVPQKINRVTNATSNSPPTPFTSDTNGSSLRIKRNPEGKIIEVTAGNKVLDVESYTENPDETLTIVVKDGKTGKTSTKTFRIKRQKKYVKTSSRSYPPAKFAASSTNKHMFSPKSPSPTPPTLERMDVSKSSNSNIAKKIGTTTTASNNGIGNNESNAQQINSEMSPPIVPRKRGRSSLSISKRQSQKDPVPTEERESSNQMRISGRSGRQIKRPYGDSSTWVSEREIDKIVDEEDAHGKRTRKMAKKSDETKNKGFGKAGGRNSDERNEGPVVIMIGNSEPCTCRICSKVFSDQEAREQHELIHLPHHENDEVEGPAYACELCVKTVASFETKEELLQHRSQKHEGRSLFTCSICKLEFYDKKQFKRHCLEDHQTDSGFFKCSICEFTTKSEQTLNEHKATTHKDVEEVYMQCESCYMAFSSSRALVQHQLRQHAKKQAYRCDRCKQLFPTMTHLRVHQKDQSQADPQQQCAECNEELGWICALSLHRKGHHNDGFKMCCEICNEIITSYEVWEEHQMSAHLNLEKLDSQNDNDEATEAEDDYGEDEY